MTLVAESVEKPAKLKDDRLISNAALEDSISNSLILEGLVVLEGVSWNTYKALLDETSDERKKLFAYSDGVLEITIENSTLENFVILEGVSWDTYKTLVQETGDERKARFAYSCGALEITMPLVKHEHIKHILERIVVAFTEELSLELQCYGSATFSSKKLRKGVEPDSCFYIKNYEPIIARAEEKIDLEKDPPPDLIVEVDISHGSKIKMDSYAAIGTSELWRFQNGQVYIYHLKESQYESSERSLAFSLLTVKNLNDWLAQHNTIGDNALIRMVRKWLREQLKENL